MSGIQGGEEGRGREGVPEMRGDVFIGVFPADDGGGEDRVCRGETRGDGEAWGGGAARVREGDAHGRAGALTGEEVQAGDERVYEAGADEPAPGHDGPEEEEERAPVAAHVRLWELDADGEDADCEDDAREFKGERVGCVWGGAAPSVCAGGGQHWGRYMGQGLTDPRGSNMPAP